MASSDPSKSAIRKSLPLVGAAVAEVTRLVGVPGTSVLFEILKRAHSAEVERAEAILFEKLKANGLETKLDDPDFAETHARKFLSYFRAVLDGETERKLRLLADLITDVKLASSLADQPEDIAKSIRQLSDRELEILVIVRRFEASETDVFRMAEKARSLSLKRKLAINETDYDEIIEYLKGTRFLVSAGLDGGNREAEIQPAQPVRTTVLFRQLFSKISNEFGP